MLDAYHTKTPDLQAELEEIKKERRELEKEKVKVRDERNEYRRLIREQARRESFLDLVGRVISEETESLTLDKEMQIIRTECDLLAHLTDIHTGIKIDNGFNRFDEEVLRKRLNRYLNKIISIRNTHHAENCYLVIGEILSGIIHNNLRLENNMDLIEQFKTASELIALMIQELAQHFTGVHIYVTPGNHSRISPKKEDSLDGENMDLLLPFYLSARLQNIKNVYIHENTKDPEIAMFNIRGHLVVASHGHKDNPNTVARDVSMMYGKQPSIILLGHRHTNGYQTDSNVKVIQSGCISGSDSYATSIRKVNDPEQTVSVINDDGLDCIYDITLN